MNRDRDLPEAPGPVVFPELDRADAGDKIDLTRPISGARGDKAG